MGVLERIDAGQRRRTWLAFPFAVVKKFGEDQAGNLAALVSYYAIFSVFPLLLVMSTVLGFVLHGHPEWQTKVENAVLEHLPLVSSNAPSHGNVPALIVGTVVALWSGLGIAKAAQTAMNTIYLVARTDRPNFVWSSLRALRLVVVGGLGFLLTTVLSTVVTAVTHIGSLDVSANIRFVAIALTMLLNTLLFIVLLNWLTVRHVGWRDALPGAVISAVALQVLQLGASAFIAHKLTGASTTYGNIASVIVLLSWFFLQAQVVLFAAEVNVVRQYRLWPRALKDPPATEADLRIAMTEGPQP